MKQQLENLIRKAESFLEEQDGMHESSCDILDSNGEAPADHECSAGACACGYWADREELRTAIEEAKLALKKEETTQETKRVCPNCKKLTRDTTAGCDHCDLEDK